MRNRKHRGQAFFLLSAFAVLLTACDGQPKHLPVMDGKPITYTVETDPSSDIALSDVGEKDEELSMPTSKETETFPSPRAGLHTLENLLSTALSPVGTTMYVWGGGWNEEDTGAGTEARSIGPSPRWKEYADAQSAEYDYHDTRYQIHDGLDCSGFVGWTVYNTMEKENGLDGYVLPSTDMAKTFASYGWGEYLDAPAVKDWLAGDIASMKGHVWICLGTCDDGSVLLVHASPPGVRVCGTSPSGQKSDASSLAESFMSSHHPEWYERFPDCTVSASYLTSSGQMRWNEQTFPDVKELRSLSPAKLLQYLAP